MSQSFLGKKYILQKSENFDEYMKKLGVGLILRKMGNTAKTECILAQTDDYNYKFILETPYRCSVIKFRLGEEFKELTLDNREVMTLCHLDGNRFVQKQSAKGLKPTKIVRQYNGDELITTLTVGNVTAVRNYVVKEAIEDENVKEK